MPQKIGAHDTEFVLREIPGEVGKRRRQDQWRDRRRRRVGEHTPMLQAMGDEVVGITTTPGGLRLRAARDLTRRCRTGTLATANAVVRHKPSATDAAGPLREHPRMLASTAENQSGPVLASNPGSILASAEERLWNNCTNVLSTPKTLIFLGYSLPSADLHAQFIFRCGFHNQFEGRLKPTRGRFKPTGPANVVIVNPDEGAATRIRAVAGPGVDCQWICSTVEDWMEATA